MSRLTADAKTMDRLLPVLTNSGVVTVVGATPPLPPSLTVVASARGAQD
jgi:hypothetical protein